MKKTMVFIVAFVVLLFSVSANTGRDFNAVEGMAAPYFMVKAADGTTISPSDKRGHFVIVNFWASNDAESRMAANRYSSYVESDREEQIALMSFNFDDNLMLFREIVRRDGLDEATQFNVLSDSRQEIISRYGLDKGLKSFLIDPEGVIVAVNPTSDQIASIAGSR
ncbi:MAG: peroxiredoxin family protein [Bacteroides sp.]|nr:peroxiredoxin family protein [Bacteroides sp.]MCM1413343.1 peroxiredoxin family protein [Bacteroides sp.]MCM1471971.1 peroxiredoxin family protein [Bacteroides sp.]